MLVVDQVGHRFGVHPFQAFDAAGIAAAINNDEDVAGVYDMVLAEIEAPLLTRVLEFTRGNQTQAATVLGLNRGTLRKKLKQYRLL